jgi:hypothetical protein
MYDRLSYIQHHYPTYCIITIILTLLLSYTYHHYPTYIIFYIILINIINQLYSLNNAIIIMIIKLSSSLFCYHHHLFIHSSSSSSSFIIIHHHRHHHDYYPRSIFASYYGIEAPVSPAVTHTHSNNNFIIYASLCVETRLNESIKMIQ